MNKKTIFVAAAMLLAIGSANAEITTVVNSVTGNKVQVPKNTQCFVSERAFFGSGGASSLSVLFAEGGLSISKDKKADCLLVVGAAITVQHKNNPTASLASEIVSEDAIMNEPEASNAAEQDTPKSTVGETAGASVGSSFGLAGAAAGAIIGSALDSRKTKYLSASTASIRADLKFKDAQGKSVNMEVIVLATADTTERPIAVLRAAVKRVVAEIQTKDEVIKTLGAEKLTSAIPTSNEVTK
ncbi:MAG: hypothetical protein WC706_05865 [Sideroxydans sp.]|jgi:hypothetical protein